MYSSSQPPTQGECPSTHTMDEDKPGQWLYNYQACVVTYTACSYDTCSVWVMHRASTIAMNDTSLNETSEQLNDTICAPLIAELATLQLLKDSADDAHAENHAPSQCA